MSIYAGSDGHSAGASVLDTYLKSTLDSAGVKGKVRTAAMTAAEPFRNQRSVAVFVERDSGRAEAIPLPGLMAVSNPHSGQGLVRVGQPFVEPLLDTTTGRQTIAAMYIDGDRWRIFRMSFSDASEVDSANREQSPAEEGSLDNSAQAPAPWVADRSAASNDLLQASVDQAKRRFYTDAAAKLQRVLFDEGLKDVVLMGPGDGPHRIAEHLDSSSYSHVWIEPSGISDPTATPIFFRERLKAKLLELQQTRERALISEIKKRGVYGLQDTLGAWQTGRLNTIILPLNFSAELWQDPTSGYLATTAETSLAAHPDGIKQTAKKVQFEDVLSTLADQFDVKLVFASRAGRAQIEDELDGIGATFRW
ncbi:MAG: hypothetical protein AAF449_17680 [Myxococcota bacterium]